MRAFNVAPSFVLKLLKGFNDSANSFICEANLSNLVNSLKSSAIIVKWRKDDRSPLA